MRRSLNDHVDMILMQGGTFEGGFQLTDEFGVSLDSSWTGRVEIRSDYGGDPIATFAATGADGTLAVTDGGRVLLTLPSSFTATLTPTADSRGLNNGFYVGDLEMWRIDVPSTKYKPETPFRVYVRPEVTTA